MLLKDLLKGVNYEIISGNENVEIQNITESDREIKCKSLYIAVKGFKVDGHSFINNAIKKGAAAILCEDDSKIDDKGNAVIIKVCDTRREMAVVASNFFGNPSSKLNLIGITGTNGKTTSAFILKSILENEGEKVGLIGTIANYIGDKKIKTERTTPGAIQLHGLFKKMVDEGAKYCVMEVSSHAIALDRVYGLDFETSIFSNLTRDHLDFHKTFEEYYNAKYKLFKMSKKCIINIDDEYGKRIVNDLKEEGDAEKITTYSIYSNSDCEGEIISLSEKGSKFKLKGILQGKEFFISIPGEYNVYNSLGCILSANVFNAKYESIRDGLKSAVVPGRCESVSKGFDVPFEVIIDYAHTPDGLLNILTTARKFTKNRLISVFGCGGDRDKVKRPIMGKIGTDLSDIAIITSDNPRTEEPMTIIEEVKSGATKENFEIVENRYEAIKRAILIAKPEDVIVIAGKGHETYQILKDKTIDFDEKVVVSEILNSLEVEKK